MQLATARPYSSPYPQMIPANMAPFSGPTTERDRNTMYSRRGILRMGGNPADFGPLSSFVEVARTHASSAALTGMRPSAYRGLPTAAALLQVEQQVAQRAAAPRSPSHLQPPCYHVCPLQSAPNPGDESHGGASSCAPVLSSSAPLMLRHRSVWTRARARPPRLAHVQRQPPARLRPIQQPAKRAVRWPIWTRYAGSAAARAC